MSAWRPWRRDAPPAGGPEGGRREIDRRGLVRSGTIGAAVLLVLALVLFVNYFGWKYHHRFDWTESQLYSLSDTTRNVLADLDRDVSVVVFLDPGDELFEPTRELLRRYEDASPHLTVRVMDPGRNLLEARQLAEKYDLDRAAVVFDDGKTQRVVPRTDLAEFDFTSMQFGGGAPEIKAFRGEQQFTRALLELTEGHKPKIVFTVGHGEIRLDDRTPAGMGELQRQLGADNFSFEEWTSLGADRVPDGTDLLVIAGPTSTFLQPELDELSAYLDGGGRLLVLLDPPPAGPGASHQIGSTGLEDWLRGYGIDAGDDVVVDPSGALPFFGAETFFVNRYPGDHAVTRPLAKDELAVLMSLARSVAKGEVPDGLSGSVLLETSADAWGETDLAHPEKTPGDVPGPVPVGVVVEAQEAAKKTALDEQGLAARAEGEAADAGGTLAADDAPGMRLVVFGDSDLATDQFLAQNFGNQVLLTDAVNWLVERRAMVGIPPRPRERVGLTLSATELRWIYLLALALLPGAGLIAGIVVYFRRRR